jgi:hypothetical protein
VVQQRRLMASVEYPGGKLGEVCFESLVGCYLWVDHRELTAKSAVGDGGLGELPIDGAKPAQG